MFCVIDAFAEVPFQGNPAGVCVLDEFPSDYELQRIAYYYNWSEIAFIKKAEGSEFFIRWFSPIDEAPLCGHATLAAAHVVFSNNLIEENSINFKYNGGEIIVGIDPRSQKISMEFPIKPVTKCSKFPFSVKKIIGAKNYIEVLKDDTIYIIVLKSADDLKAAIPNFEEIKKIDARAVAVTAIGDDPYDFSSRYFAPKVGIYEDPVCGSMHCRLAYYWQNRLGKNKFLAYQASKRSGILDVEIKGSDKVVISGNAVTVCKMDRVQERKRSTL